MKHTIKTAFAIKITRGVVTVHENDTAFEISQIMEEEDIGAVVVIRNGKIAGMVSERDIVRRVVAKRKNPFETRVKEFMTKDVVTAQYSDGLEKIHQMMCKLPFRHLPILDGQKLIGIVSNRDILYSLRTRLGVAKSAKK